MKHNSQDKCSASKGKKRKASRAKESEPAAVGKEDGVEPLADSKDGEDNVDKAGQDGRAGHG